MKLSVTQENLSQALSAVSRVATNRSALPVLANVLLKTKKNRLLLVATNLEIAISQTVGAKVEQDGAITVPARLMHDYISSLPAGNISLEAEGSRLHIESGDYSSAVNGVSAEEFPSLPTIQEGQSFKLKALDFKKALQQTIFTASSEETRPILTGAFLHTFKNSLYLVATDSYRLAEKRLGQQKGDFSLVIPASALNDMLRIIGDGAGELSISYDEAQVRFNYDQTELITRQIDGEFPKYRQLIPKESDVSFSVDKEEFINITKVAALFARESAGSVNLETIEKEKAVSITAVASQVGENVSRASAKTKGSGKVSLNSRYLLEALNVIEGNNIKFRFGGKVSPCVLTSEEDSDYLHIIMPLKS